MGFSALWGKFAGELILYEWGHTKNIELDARKFDTAVRHRQPDRDTCASICVFESRVSSAVLSVRSASVTHDADRAYIG